MKSKPDQAILRALRGERIDPPPVWMMRQAGRHLPEYRELRARAGSFLEFCYAPAMAAEATLQPIHRYGFDAAILFSDILTIPDALGRSVRFVEGEGPRLAPLMEEPVWHFDEIARAVQRLSPVHEAAERVRAALDPSRALIGFVGGPWTVATYMLSGKGGERDVARRFAYAEPEQLDGLLALLVEVSAQHLAMQVKAGCDILQIFESWAEMLPEALFRRVVIRPTQDLIKRLRALGVMVPIVGFPRGAGVLAAVYGRETGVDALALDHGAAAPLVRQQLPQSMPLQGNLDPELLTLGGIALEKGVRDVLTAFAGGPHVFNLGHGITPQADPANVVAMLRAIRGC